MITESYSRNIKWLRIMSGTILVFVVVATSLFFRYMYHHTIREATNTIESLAESTVQIFDGMIGEIDFVLQLAGDEVTKQNQGDSITDYFEKQRNRMPFIDFLRASNEKGDVIYGTDVKGKSANISDREYFKYLRDHASSEIHITEPVISKINKKWVWIFSRKITGESGNFIGIVYAGIFVDQLRSALEKIEVRDGNIITIRGLHHEFVARNHYENEDQGEKIGDKTLSVSFQEALAKNKKVGMYTGKKIGIKNEEFLNWYQRSALYGFTVIVGTPLEVVFAEWKWNLYTVSILGIVFILFLFIFSHVVVVSWKKQEANLKEIKKASEQLKLSSLVFNSANEAMSITDVNNRFVSVNKSFCELTGYSESELIGQSPNLLKSEHEHQKASFYKKMWHDLMQEGNWVGEIWNRRKNGEEYAERLSISVAYDEHGMILNYIAIASDITENKKVEQKLKELSLAVEQSPASVMITDRQGHITYVNPKFCAVTGYSVEDVIGLTPKILRSGYTSDDLYQVLWKTISSGKEWRGEMKNRKKNGDLFWEYSSFSSIKDNHGNITHYIAIKEDITIRKEYEEKLIKQVNYDTLTGLPNRLLAMDRLSQAISRAEREGERVGVMLIDLDHFKKINDTLGHATGDRFLKQVSKRFTAAIRESDTVARLGGDEFMVILPALKDTMDIDLVAEKLLSSIKEKFNINEEELYVSASIGITVYPDDEKDCDLLMRNADIAMYKAKEGGRGVSQFFASEMNLRAYENLQIETELRHAINLSEIFVHYQPLVDIVSNRVIGAEALIRWNSKKLGNIPPGKFIPLAESTGLIVPIGEWVLRAACDDAMGWMKHSNTPLHVAVNVSSKQLEQRGFLKIVEDTLQTTGLPPKCLKLEITEGVLMRDAPETKKTIEDICKLGVRLALDDFGTGYSSLSYLRHYPFDTLKIDRSFVKDIPDSPEAVNLVNAIIAMAHGMRMTVVGEGIETMEQKEFLKNAGCEISQGWLTGKPMSSENFLNLVKNQQS
ncbi:diguanylate cyclase [Gammaproteobacteria bacterium]